MPHAATLRSDRGVTTMRAVEVLRPHERDPDPVHRLHLRVLGIMREGVNVSDGAGTIVYVNGAEEAMFGAAPGQLIGRRLVELSAEPPDEAARRNDEMLARLRETGVWTGRSRCRRLDGAEFVTQARATVITIDGDPFVVRVQEDITGFLDAVQRAHFLGEVSRALAGTLDFREALAVLTRLCVPFLADAASVEVMARDGSLERLAVADGHPAREGTRRAAALSTVRPEDARLVKQVLRSAQPVLLDDLHGTRRAHAPFDTTSPRSLILVPLLARGTAFGVLVLAMSDSGRRHTADDLELATELATRAGSVVERARLYTAMHRALSEARAAERREELRAAAAEVLGDSLETDAALDRLARLLVPERADWCAIHLLRGSDRGTLVAAAHRDPAGRDTLRLLDALSPSDSPTASGIAAVLRNGGREVHARVDDDLLARMFPDVATRDRVRALFDGAALVIVPIAARGRVLGALTLASLGHDLPLDEHTVALAEAIAARTASTLENARLHEEAHAARHEAERASRAKSELLANVSHDLRTPLNAIGGYAQLLEIGVYGPLDVLQHEALARIQRSQQQLLGLIDDLLTFTRLDARKVKDSLVPIDAGAVAADAVELIRPRAQQRELVLEFTSLPDARALAEPEKLLQALLHLLANAVKFTPPGGVIATRLLADEESVRVEVGDTGGGIPAHQLETIFQPLTQLARDYNHPQEGSGMGLAISRELVRAMGGRLTVRSEVGKGSTFTIVLPRARGGLSTASD